MDAQQIQKAAADWLTQRCGDGWSHADQARLDRWLDENLAHRIAYIRVESVWKEVGRLQAVGASGTRGIVPPRGRSLKWVPPASDRPPGAATPQRFGFRFARRPAAIAAGLALAAVAAAGFYAAGVLPRDQYVTQIGRIDTVALDDGSNVILNTDSRIRVDIKPDVRRIELAQGEAFFEVAKDPARPFIVEAGDKRVVAVGTQFSVRRIKDDVHVVVTEGSVRLEHSQGKGSRAELLRAGGIARTREERIALEQRPLPQVEEFLSWRQGYLVFRDSPLREAVAEFNRYNTRKMVIADPSIADIQIGGHFRATSTDVFLWMLRNGFPVTVEEGEREVVLKRR